MILKVSKDLKKQEIWANGVELCNIMGMDFVEGKRISFYPSNEKVHVHTFSNPVLMTDNYRISKLEPTKRDTLFSLFQSKPRIVEYDGISTFWDDTHRGVWCPSIDTILFAKALRIFLKGKNDIVRAVEVGCGSGFLTKYILEKDENIKEFLTIDINPYAIKSVDDNISDDRLIMHCGDALEKIRDEKFDLIICNPPYVPRPKSIDDNPYEGISLLRELVHEGQKYLNREGILIVNVSNLSWDLVFNEDPIMQMKVLDTMKVPLKVNNILNNKQWMSYLKEQGLEKKMEEGYEYWQEINIMQFKKVD